MKDRIYFDNAATTAMDERVLQEMLPFLKDSYGNPNGKYSIGYEARKAVNEARRKAACLINAEPDEIYFTSGGTEGNNTVINGFLSSLGLDDVKIQLNTLGDSESRNNYREALIKYFEPHINELCEDCQERFKKNPLRILDCKVDADNELLRDCKEP